MFIVEDVQGRYCPRIHCDACGKQITDVRMANVIYGEADKTTGAVPAYHVHKGVCDQQITARHGDDGGTDELPVYIVYLLNNLGMTPEMLANARKTVQMLNTLG